MAELSHLKRLKAGLRRWLSGMHLPCKYEHLSLNPQEPLNEIEIKAQHLMLLLVFHIQALV